MAIKSVIQMSYERLYNPIIKQTIIGYFIETLVKVRPSLVYYLFPVPMFTKNRGGQEVIIDY